MKSNKITVEFFHDVLCAYCYALSPRLRKLAEKYPQIEVIHRSFTLSFSPDDTIRAFGSMENAKQVILGHWKSANLNDDEQRINTDLMKSRDFDYPYSLPAAKACKAAEAQGGQSAHWDYFDRVQNTHLTKALNIGDPEVLISIAGDLGLDTERFSKDMQSTHILDQVQDDLSVSQQYGVRSVPSIVVNHQQLVSGALNFAELEKSFQSLLEDFEVPSPSTVESCQGTY
jgi:putative protein-disulfide isomerase